MSNSRNKKLLACFLVTLSLSANSPNVSADFNIKQAGSNIRFAFRIFGGKKVKERDDLNKLADEISSFLTNLDIICAGNIGNATIESMTRDYIDICTKLKEKLSEIIKNRENVDSKLSHSIQDKNIINEFPEPINSGSFRLFNLNKLKTWLGKFLEIQGGHFTIFGRKVIDNVRELSKVDMYEKLRISPQFISVSQDDDGENTILNNNQNINNNNQQNNYGYELNDDQNKVLCLNCKKLFDKNSITNRNCMECNKKTQELLDQPANGFYGNGLNYDLPYEDEYDLPYENELYNQNINNQSQNNVQNNILENSGHYNYNFQDNDQNINNNNQQNNYIGYELNNDQNKVLCLNCKKLFDKNSITNGNCMECNKKTQELLDQPANGFYGNGLNYDLPDEDEYDLPYENELYNQNINNQSQNNVQNNILGNSGNYNFQNNVLENSEYNLINNNNNNDKNIDDQMVCLICTNPIADGKTVGFCKNKKCGKIICGECIQKLQKPDQCPFCRQNSGFDLN